MAVSLLACAQDLQHAALLERQRNDGSWEPIGPWGMYGGEVYSTALMVLALQAAYS